MHLQKENAHPHTIRAYDDHAIQIGNTTYQNPLLITTQAITPCSINEISSLTHEVLNGLIEDPTEIVLIGHPKSTPLHPTLYEALYKRRIGLEVMGIGAACRTFNILLGEGRRVSLLLFLAPINKA